MAIVLASKPGITGGSTLSIPKSWDQTWFRGFIANQLKGADVRNAVGVNGITVTGNLTSPYATIGFGAPVTLPGPVTINAPASGTTLTVNAPAGGVSINASTRSSTAVFAQDATISSSGGDYPYFGYNAGATTTTGVYDYLVSDFASAIQFASGAILLKTAPSGTAGNPITLTTALTVAQNGSVSVAAPATAVTAFLVQSNGGTTFAQQLTAGSATMSNALLFFSGGASSAGVEVIRADHCATTGTGTPTFTATNKPTATAGGPVTWLPINVDGARRYIPLWA